MITPNPHPCSNVPERTCIGCRKKGTKVELLRVARASNANGQTIVAADLRGTAPGRGAYLHPTEACLALAERRRAFGRALRHTEGSLDLSELRGYLVEVNPAPQHHQSNRDV